jgi:hypothetical protein
MTKNRVYIVLKAECCDGCSGVKFVGVYFDKASAEAWIKECKYPYKYSIETYEQHESGMAEEVYD